MSSRVMLPAPSAGGPVVLVAGGGGFIGGALVASLVASGSRVRAVDRRPLDAWERLDAGAESLVLDLRDPDACGQAVAGTAAVYNLAADMGGMGFIEHNKALCMLSVLDQHPHAARRPRRGRRALLLRLVGLRLCRRASRPRRRRGRAQEADAYPAMPEDGYGWEKLFSERHVPALRRGLRPRHPRGPLPQRLRPARHLDRRSREGAGGDLPQGDRGAASAATTRSRSGATASRPAASSTSTTASRARG